jgi:hypothetical protein
VRTLASSSETWRILFADIGEAVTYCPECAVREFDPDQRRDEPSAQRGCG